LSPGIVDKGRLHVTGGVQSLSDIALRIEGVESAGVGVVDAPGEQSGGSEGVGGNDSAVLTQFTDRIRPIVEEIGGSRSTLFPGLFEITQSGNHLVPPVKGGLTPHARDDIPSEG
jgi:hypothetical protein